MDLVVKAEVVVMEVEEKMEAVMALAVVQEMLLRCSRQSCQEERVSQPPHWILHCPARSCR